jgi:hypothetical protein
MRMAPAEKELLMFVSYSHADCWEMLKDKQMAVTLLTAGTLGDPLRCVSSSPSPPTTLQEQQQQQQQQR